MHIVHSAIKTESEMGKCILYNLAPDCMSGMEWTRHNGVRMSTGTIQTDHVTSVAECINNCVQSPLCDSINFRSTDKSCELVQHVTPLTVDSTDIVADINWQWWRATFTVVV